MKFSWVFFVWIISGFISLILTDKFTKWAIKKNSKKKIIG